MKQFDCSLDERWLKNKSPEEDIFADLDPYHSPSTEIGTVPVQEKQGQL